MPLITGYPACCGASIITGFGRTPNAKVPVTAYNPSTGRYEVQESGMTVGEKLLKDISAGYANKLFTCILTTGQYRYWGKWLKANGFIHTTVFVNSVHNSTLHHFVYVKKTKTCKVQNNTEPPKRWEEYPGPTPDADSSTETAIVPPSEVKVAA